jgi:hypothetical protein
MVSQSDTGNLVDRHGNSQLSVTSKETSEAMEMIKLPSSKKQVR